MHLAAAADTGYVGSIRTGQQLGDAFHHGPVPILGSLLAPAGLGELQGILFGDDVFDRTCLVHQQQLDSGGTQVDTDVQFQMQHSYTRKLHNIVFISYNNSH